MCFRKFTSKLVIASGLFTLVGCATKAVPVESSTYLLRADQDFGRILTQVSEELKKSGYEVASIDPTLGVLTFSPRQFVVVRNKERSYGHQKLQLKREGGSIKVHVSYECQYQNQTGRCMSNDRAALDKIRRVDGLLLSIINRQIDKVTEERLPASKDL